ncbi:imelysin family protein [Oceanimonas pelagia]|uniref:Imelysin family protein n=1 Tax=Oceanimonas pelagia TaxID=3028314 RepID=A0AA50Q7N7_9GAMM|nr:imelysin family protein [Oceanimonas pelagia]WMC10750.1 imelysin family protein [Oceanimonas pelagia]
MHFRKLALAAAIGGLLSACAQTSNPTVTQDQVVEHYADIAQAVYGDALTSAQQLDKAIAALLASPSEQTLADARTAWLAARVPYQQSEVFRFGNPVVDDWEGQLNAWPLDEGLIDYVAPGYQHELGNAGATANIIANSHLQVGGEKLDVTNITPELLAGLNELAGSEANVATGYHAIEFLLWGQDLNDTHSGAGERPWTDFALGEACTHGHCDRRRDYLQAASRLLVQDLQYMAGQWQPGQNNYRTELTALPAEEGLRRMLFGMGSLSLGELAGERMKVALVANSVEDEHDCFSDNTHHSHYYNEKGISNLMFGEYQRIDGSTLQGPSLLQLVAQQDDQAAAQIGEQFRESEQAVYRLVQSAEVNNVHFDQLIAADNPQGNQLVTDAISALVEQTRAIELAANTLGINNLNPDTADHEF